MIVSINDSELQKLFAGIIPHKRKIPKELIIPLTLNYEGNSRVVLKYKKFLLEKSDECPWTEENQSCCEKNEEVLKC